MATITIEVPDEVFSLGPDAWWSLSRWDGQGLPDALVLTWIDELELGPWAPALLAQIDPTRLDPRALPTYLRAFHRVETWSAARKSQAVALIAADPPKDAGVVDPAAHEVSAALRKPVGAAQRDVFIATRLAKFLPETDALFRAGSITKAHVDKIVLGTGHLTAEQCADVEDRVLHRATTQSVQQFAAAVRRAVADIDPQSFAERHAAEAAKSDVTVEADEDGMAWLTARMPLVDALAVKKAADHRALGLKKSGDARPIGVLRAESLRTFADAYLTGDLTGHVPTHHGRPVEVQVVVTLDALVGLSDTPAEVPGHGPVPIDTVRDAARDAKLRFLIVDPDSGHLLHRDTQTWRVPAAMQAEADARYVMSIGPYSTVPAERCDSEHQDPWPQGPTTSDNTAPMDRAWHIAKTKRGLTAKHNPDHTITWRTPLGQTVTVEPYDYRLGP
ncbi:MAG: DUF222 domain-containing protein [Frankiales bacterium]|nr:DUF222 domain-containing protein [Frankiales bacterium]